MRQDGLSRAGFMLPAEHRQLVRCRLSQDRFEGAGGLANRQCLGHSVLEDRGPDGLELRARRVGLASAASGWGLGKDS